MLLLLAEEIPVMVQGRAYDIDFANGSIYNFYFTPTFDGAPTVIEITNVEVGSSFNIKICETIVCYGAYESWNFIKAPTAKVTYQLNAGYQYALQMQRLNNNTRAKVIFEQFQGVLNHQHTTLWPDNGRMQFMFVNCQGLDVPALFQTSADTKFYLSLGNAYVDETNCTEYCGASELNVSNFTTIRGTIVTTSTSDKVSVYVEQAQFADVAFGGSAQAVQLSKSSICAGFFKINISYVFDGAGLVPGVESVAIMAYHAEPYKDGGVAINVSETDDFVSKRTSEDGRLLYAKDELLALKDSPVLYISIKQLTYLNAAELLEFSEVMVSVTPNIAFSQQRQVDTFALKPFHKDDDVVTRTAGTKALQYSFLTNNVSAEITLQGIVRPYRHFYVFKMITDIANTDYVYANLYVDYDSIANATNNIPITKSLKEGDKLSYFAMQPANNSKCSNGNFAVGQSLFVTGTAYRQQLESVVPEVQATFEADTVVEVFPRQRIHQKQESDILTYYYSIPRIAAAAEQGGMVAVVYVKYCSKGKDTFHVYSSASNPLPNERQHDKYHGHFTNVTVINFPYTSINEIKQDYIAVVKDYDTCAVFINTSYHGDNLPMAAEGYATTIMLADKQTAQYAVVLNGFSYSKQNGWLKLQMKGENPTKFKLDVTVSEHEVFAGDTSAQNYVLTDSMQGDFSMHQFEFQLKGFRRYYVSITRTTLDDAYQEQALEVLMQAGAYANLEQQQREIVPTPTTEFPTLLRYQAGPTDDLHFQVTGEEDVKLSYCGSVIPTLEELSELCVPMQRDSAGDFSISLRNYVFSSSKGYVALLPTGKNTSSYVYVTLQTNSILRAERAVDVKTSGLPYYFAMDLPRTGDDRDVAVAEMLSCENCVVCLSFSSYAPNYNISSPQSSTCDFIVGRVAADDQEFGSEDSGLKKFNKTASHAASGKSTIYGQILSLGSLGLVEKVRFKVSLQKSMQADVGEGLLLGYTEDMSAKDGDVVYYPQMNYKIYISKAVLTARKAISLSVAPRLTNAQTVDNYESHHFSIYASAKHQIPMMGKCEWFTDKEHGIASLSFAESDIEQIVEQACLAESNDCFLYVAVVASRDSPLKYSDVELYLAADGDYAKPSNVTHAVAFGRVNNLGAYALGARQIYHFNVLAQPMTFVMAPCAGTPRLRAGKTDFFRRSAGHDADLEQEERVFYSGQTEFGKDVYFLLRDGSEYTGEADWFFEIFDDRAPAEGAAFAAELVAGNGDPRPGTPIRALEVGVKKGHFQVRFHPAVSANKNDSASSMEYSIFMLADLGDGQAAPYNQHAACGYTLGGLQLQAEWTTFSQFADRQMIESNVDFSEYLDRAKAGHAYITVVARQKDTQMMRSYAAERVDMSALPGELKVSSALGQWELLGIALACIVVVAAAVLLGIWGWRRHQASKAVFARE